MIAVADIERMLADYQPPPDPFNGATRLVLAPGVLKALGPALEPWANNPLMGRCPEIEVRPTMPEGSGLGFRAWREGDDEIGKIIGQTLVWVLASKSI